MKRFSSLFLAVLATLTLLIPLAARAEWVTVPLDWRLVNQGSPYSSTGIWARDTTFARFAGVITSNGGTLDTTATFSPKGKPVRVGHAASGAVAFARDSLLLGYLIFQQDTSTTTDPTFSTITIAIDGRAGGFGTALETNQWQAVDTISVGVVVGEGTVVVPVRPMGAFRLASAYQDLRARAIAGVGILYSARASWRYWRD